MRAARGAVLIALVGLVPASVASAQDAGRRLGEPSSSAQSDPSPSSPTSFAMRSRFTLFAEGRLALDLHGAEPAPRFAYGPGLAFQLTEGLSVGLRSISFGMSSAGGQVSLMFGGALYLEPSVFVDPHVQLYAQVGVRVMGFTGAGFGGDRASVLLTMRGGARFWLTDWMTLGVEAGFDLWLTESYGPAGPAPGSVTPHFGLTLGFHF